LKFEFADPNQLFWLSFILWLLLIYIGLSKSLSINKIRVTIILRIISVGVIVFLFLEPKLNFLNISKHDLDWHIYVDRSLSMAYHKNPSVGSLVSGIDEIIDKLNSKMVKTKIYGFGSKLDTNWIYGEKNIQDGSTSIGEVFNHLKSNKNNKIAGSILITDGQINLGPEIPNKHLDDVKPIYVLGIGDNSPFVDISIQSIDAPPVIIKGENAELEVMIASSGNVNQKLNIMLYSEKKLLGSKIITVSGEGSLERVRFMINPDHTGEMQYKVQVNALPDEINIENNKQVVSIQVLKNLYRIAIITGAPNFNTQIIKKIVAMNSKFEFDHFVFQPDGYSEPLKKFWDTKYDLIIFDNNPVQINSKEWASYIRVIAKKILSQKTSLAIVVGHDMNKEIFQSYLNLMDLNVKESVIELHSDYQWELTSNWESFFPFYSDEIGNKKLFNYPPLFIDMEIDSLGGTVLANFLISEMEVPLLILAEKAPLRYMVWTSPDLYQLYYKTQNTEYKDFSNQILQPVFSWLTRTSNEKDFYFRSSKNSYQQGEQVSIKGKPVRNNQITTEGFIHIYNNGSLINTKKLTYNKDEGLYIGQFWASESGKLDYNIELIYGDNSMIVSKGYVQVQESQIELNNVFLNKYPLKKLAEITRGGFYHWDDKTALINQINKKSKDEIIHSRVILYKNKIIFFILLILLTVEWILRRRLGML